MTVFFGLWIIIEIGSVVLHIGDTLLVQIYSWKLGVVGLGRLANLNFEYWGISLISVCLLGKK